MFLSVSVTLWFKKELIVTIIYFYTKTNKKTDFMSAFRNLCY